MLPPRSEHRAAAGPGAHQQSAGPRRRTADRRAALAASASRRWRSARRRRRSFAGRSTRCSAFAPTTPKSVASTKALEAWRKRCPTRQREGSGRSRPAESCLGAAQPQRLRHVALNGVVKPGELEHDRNDHHEHHCSSTSRRAFLSDMGMGFAGLALGAMLHRDGSAASITGRRRPGSRTSRRRPRA